MKTIAKLTVGVAMAAGAALATAAPAEAAHVSVGIGVGVPGYYGGYYAPPPYPAYAGCDPYYYDCGRYYGPAYYPGYVGFYAGGRGYRHHGWHGHRGHGGWHHHR
jgi:hypothetical protein